ncbi:NACHT domain-containing NTPase [Arcicella rosea]|uniref:Molybdopterin biosynthesis enzyme MoaB n=1 Tax=Arcicella rosea TaxID=502909 RepID=A0A841EXU3_9BACT|nr:AAA family ATPase [Arcicella rosea]MBB6005130.1 molybdopterin biosynthesis enzyme MoaB [Arcicella rosea]
MNTKPISQTPNSSHNYFALQNDRKFEELLHSIFSQEIKTGEYKGVFDCSDLKPIGADKGIDVDLYKDGLKAGGIQCKWVSKLLDKATVSKEVIKFVLHYMLDNENFIDLNSYSYFLAAPKGFAKDVRPFIENFSNQVVCEPDFEKWTKAVIRKYETFKNAQLTFANVEKRLKTLLKLIKIEPIISSKLDNYLAKEANKIIIGQFWSVRTVIDSETLLKELGKQTDEIIDAIREPQSPNLLSPDVINQDFKIASTFVSELSNEFDNIEGSHIERDETLQILEWLNSDLSDDKKNNSLLLVGGAGVGKSVIMKDLVCHLMDSEVPVIAIKSDKYAPETVKDLEAQLNLKDSLEREIKTLLMNGIDKVVVIIDQIDALSQTQSNRREPLNTFRTLINTLSTIPQVRIVISARPFDLQEDADLIVISRKASKIEVKDLTIEQIETVLQKKNFNIQTLSEPLKQLLKNASNLDLFCRVLNDTLDFNRLATRQDLQQELFKQRIVNNRISSPDCIMLVYDIAEKMYEQERINISSEPFQIRYKRELAYLVSEGILTLKKDYIQFFHQTFYDFTYAKSFVHKGKSILEYIIENHQGLKIRTVVKMVFDFTRGNNPKEYLRLLNEVLFSDAFSYHLKHLLITNLCFLREVSIKEKAFVRSKILTSQTFKKAFLESVNSPDWLQFLIEENIFNDLLNPDLKLYETDKNRDIALCSSIFNRFLQNSTDIVLEYVSESLLDYEGKERIISDMLFYLKVWTNPIACDLFEKYFQKPENRNRWFFYILENAVSDQPDWVITQFEIELYSRKSTNSYSRAEIKFEHSEKKLLTLLFKKHFDKTLEFSVNLIKKVIEETKFRIERHSDDVLSSFMGDTAISGYSSIDSAEGSVNHETFYGIVMDNVKKIAKEEPQAFRTFFYAHIDNLFLIIQRLLVKGLLENPQEYSKECFLFIFNFGQQEGFELRDEYTYYVRELIAISYPRFSEQEKNQVDEFLLNIKDKFHLKCYSSGEKKIHYLSWYGRKKLLSLSSIPIEEILKKLVLKKKYQELKRKHPNVKNEAPRKSIFRGVPAPYSQRSYHKMTLTHWEKTFLKIDSDKLFIDSNRGSMIEHYSQFTKEVKERPDYFLPLINKLVSDWKVKEEYILAGIEGLVEAEYDGNVITKMVNQVIECNHLSDYSKLRVYRISSYLLKNRTISSNIVTYMITNCLDEKYEIQNLNRDEEILLDRIDSVRGSAILHLMDCSHLPEFHIRIVETVEQIAEGSNIMLKTTVMTKLPNWLVIDKEKVIEIFLKLTSKPHPEVFKYAGIVAQELNWTHFEKLQDFYKMCFEYEDVMPEIAEILYYYWINGNDQAYNLLMSMANDNSKVKAKLVDSSAQVLKECEPKYWEKSIEIFEMFMDDCDSEVVDAYGHSFLWLPKERFSLLLPSIKKYAKLMATKKVSRYYYEYLLSGVRQYPKDCLELVEHFDKYQEPSISEGNYYDKEVIQIILSVYNVLFEEDAEQNHHYLVKAISIFDRILQNDTFRSTSDMVLREVEN